MSAFNTILKTVENGTKLRTPDKSSGKPFIVEKVDYEGVDVRTYSGGKVRIGLFTFEVALKYLTDHLCTGDTWMPVKDQQFQMLMNMENARVRASSYVISILGAAGLIDIDGSRPNKVRLRSEGAGGEASA